MYSQTSIGRHPAMTMWMIEQSLDQRPRVSVITAFEKRCWFYSAIQDVWFIWSSGCYLPDILQGKSTLGGKLNCGFLRIGPTLSEIISGTKYGSPNTLRRSPHSAFPGTPVISNRVNSLAVKIWPTNFPARTLSV